MEFFGHDTGYRRKSQDRSATVHKLRRNSRSASLNAPGFSRLAMCPARGMIASRHPGDPAIACACSGERPGRIRRRSPGRGEKSPQERKDSPSAPAWQADRRRSPGIAAGYPAVAPRRPARGAPVSDSGRTAFPRRARHDLGTELFHLAGHGQPPLFPSLVVGGGPGDDETGGAHQRPVTLQEVEEDIPPHGHPADHRPATPRCSRSAAMSSANSSIE